MSIFEEFDKQVDINKINEQKKEAQENQGQYDPLPSGQYICKIENMELGQTKDGRPMFKVQMRVIEGCGSTENDFLKRFKNSKPCMFMNRVIFGTKNDGNMIASVEGWLNKIFPDEPVTFTSYTDFAQEITDCFESIDADELEFRVSYDPDAFNNISIEEVL